MATSQEIVDPKGSPDQQADAAGIVRNNVPLIVLFKEFQSALVGHEESSGVVLQERVALEGTALALANAGVKRRKLRMSAGLNKISKNERLNTSRGTLRFRKWRPLYSSHVQRPFVAGLSSVIAQDERSASQILQWIPDCQSVFYVL